MKRLITALLAAALVLSLGLTAFAAETADMADACAALILSVDELLPGDEWAVIALARSSMHSAVPHTVYNGYLSSLASHLRASEGVLSRTKYTEYARTALALAALNKNPRDFEGFDLLAPLYDYDAVVKQGINGPAWALLALDFSGLPGENSAEMDIRQKYIDYILAHSLENGGFALTGESYDVDVTAMAALALFRYEGEANTAAQNAGNMLANARKDGYYLSLGRPTCESAAQAVIALCTLGAPRDEIEAAFAVMTRFYIDGKGFAHEPGGTADRISTIQAMLALAALERYESGSAFLFDMGFEPLFHDLPEEAEGAAAVYALARSGIITGFDDGSFAPQATLTRAQLAAIFVRALGLSSGDEVFSDVPEAAWYATFVNAAAAHGIIEGRGDGVFDPLASVTRQEGSIMLARAAALCGLESYEYTYTENGMLTRLEAAQMIYSMLLAAEKIEP